MNHTTTINGLAATLIPEMQDFLNLVMPEGYHYEERGGFYLFQSVTNGADVELRQGADGRIDDAAMFGYQKPNGERPGMFHFAVEYRADGTARVINIQNDVYHTERRTKAFKLFRRAVIAFAAKQ